MSSPVSTLAGHASASTATAPAPGTSGAFADKVQMQHRLFAELSAMFGKEVPLYDKSLLVNFHTNKAVCALLSQLHQGFVITDEQLDKTSGERHGAIRIGRPDEYRWVARFFAQFAMEPHNFYDMTNVGSKSQPIIATAFRSPLHPEHRVFTSLLMTDYFDPDTRKRIEELLATRTVFSDAAKALIEKGERSGGLSLDDATALIAEGTGRIFKWTAQACDHALYKALSDAGFKIAADIACFRSHHLNHLTPNTFCMDLYTAAMKFAMGEMDQTAFITRATGALERLAVFADRDYMHLTFKHLSAKQIDALKPGRLRPGSIGQIISALVTRLTEPDLRLSELKHAGFKDFTEGPSEDTPVLLRQDAYKALTEPVTFTNPDGSVVQTVHTARFGEIEQRFYATTPAGRSLYDTCLTQADAAREKDPALPKRDFPAYQAVYAAPFKPFPKTLRELILAGLVYAHFSPTPAGLAAAKAGKLSTTDHLALYRDGHLAADGLRYEDFLPVSAAGIFASNLNQYGTKSTAATKPTYTQAQLEEVMGKKIITADATYAGLQAQSLLASYAALNLVAKLPASVKADLEAAAARVPSAPSGSSWAQPSPA
jgi:uncharacterized glyoxalase superfamily metalloenzyme YdcJ